MSAAASSLQAADDRCRRPAVAPLRDRLGELMALVLAIPADVYTARPVNASGAIGGHVRHALDHIATLVAASPMRTLNYDDRARGTSVEHDPSTAVREMMRLDAALARWTEQRLDESIVVSTMTSTYESLSGWSTLARELAFVVAHTVHHQAMIALLLEWQGIQLPSERFGLAPSTPSRH
jgi:uncharacterized damage-inducible protein DinB